MNKKYIVAGSVLIILTLITAFLLPNIVKSDNFERIEINTEIPKLYFIEDISDLDKKQEVKNVSFVFEYGSDITKGFAELKLQGKSSLSYEKKNYTIKLYKDLSHNEKLKLNFWGEGGGKTSIASRQIG